VGLRYQSALPTQDLSGLPSPLRASIIDSYDHFCSKDRGGIRAGNDKTIDSRADDFVNWLRRKGVKFELLAGYSSGQQIALAGAYIREVNLGLAGCQNKSNVAEKTLNGYLKSISTWWRQYTGQHMPLYQQLPNKKEPQLDPFLEDIIAQRRAWKEPKQKREPFTDVMFLALAKELRRLQKHNGAYFLSAHWAVLDFSRLGLHTGSRLSEYGQNGKQKKGDIFSRVPMERNAGEWAGMPIAFIRADFTYFDKDLIRRHFRICIATPGLAKYVHIRFRFDKSVNNFTIRKYESQPGNLLCPVDSSLSILKRADMLGIPADYPVGAYRPMGACPGSFAFLKGDDMQRVMQQACVLAYPNPNHYMRLHMHLLMSHSNRITAAVALHNAGVSIPVIAHRLRWSVDSVSFYLRDCFKAIGPLTQKAIEGSSLI